MGRKTILFRSAAREKVLKGTSALADAVRVTLGPKSKSVLIQKKWGVPLVCNDGETIAKEVSLSDPEENLGAQMLRQAAERTGDLVGDGTSTSTILAQAIFSDGIRNVVAGASAVDLKRGLERGLEVAMEALRSMSRPVRERREKAQVAMISAHNDASIGELVAEAMEKVGDAGVITVESSKGMETKLELVMGMQFDRGYLSPYFITDAEKSEAVIEDALVFIHDRKISTLVDVVKILEKIAKSGKPVLFIAVDVEGDALATLVVNQIRGTIQCIAVKAPGFGEQRQAMLEDIAVITGGTLLSDTMGIKLDEIELDQLGRAARVVSDREKTTIVGGIGDASTIASRVRQLQVQLEKSTSDYEQEKLRERIARLSGGIAVIRVGAASEAEAKSKRDALSDAISATRAAVEEGIVAGGGLALLRCTHCLAAEEENSAGDFRTGLAILRRALTAPTRQIAENSDVDGGVVVSRMLESNDNIGFDAARNEYVDLFAAGIVDPTKVVRIALQNAVSVASLLLLTEATITEADDDTPTRGEGGNYPL